MGAVATVAAGGSLERLTVKLLVGPDDPQHNASRKHLAKFLVILLLHLLDLQVDKVTLLDGSRRGFLVSRVHVLITAHLVEKHALLVLHLPVEGEESRRLPWIEAGLCGDELFQLGLKSRRVELAMALGL